MRAERPPLPYPGYRWLSAAGENVKRAVMRGNKVRPAVFYVSLTYGHVKARRGARLAREERGPAAVTFVNTRSDLLGVKQRRESERQFLTFYGVLGVVAPAKLALHFHKIWDASDFHGSLDSSSRGSDWYVSNNRSDVYFKWMFVTVLRGESSSRVVEKGESVKVSERWILLYYLRPTGRRLAHLIPIFYVTFRSRQSNYSISERAIETFNL